MADQEVGLLHMGEK